MSVTRALDLGANDYVVKPIDVPVLLSRITTLTADEKVKGDRILRIKKN